MSTANDICTRALRRLRIIGATETIASEDADAALTAFNNMANGWRADGVDVVWTNLALTDDFPLDPSFERGVTALLAVYIADEYGKDPTLTVVNDAANGWDQLCAAYTPAMNVTLDSGLTRMPSQGNRVWNF